MYFLMFLLQNSYINSRFYILIISYDLCDASLISLLNLSTFDSYRSWDSGTYTKCTTY